MFTERWLDTENNLFLLAEVVYKKYTAVILHDIYFMIFRDTYLEILYAIIGGNSCCGSVPICVIKLCLKWCNFTKQVIVDVESGKQQINGHIRKLLFTKNIVLGYRKVLLHCNNMGMREGE